MRRTIIAGLLAATTLVPTLASAQPYTPRERAELRRERAEVREERREYRDAVRRGDPRDIREERREYRDARRDYRQDRREFRRDWGRDDWRQYRVQNRNLYRGYGYSAPFRYQTFRSGFRIAPSYYSQRFFIADPYRYRLPNPGWNQRWVRHYNDVLLVDVRRGIVVDVIRGFFW